MLDYARATRPREPVEAPVRFETPAGRQGQVDFGTFTLPWGRRHALVVVLGYSRLLWLHFYPRQTMAVLMEALESAFDRFGGVPEELLFPGHLLGGEEPRLWLHPVSLGVLAGVGVVGR